MIWAFDIELELTMLNMVEVLPNIYPQPLR
jgi:hypothetical protein